MINVTNPILGNRIEIPCPLDGVFYAGELTEVADDGNHIIANEDTEVKVINIAKGSWTCRTESTIHENTAVIVI